MKKRFFSVLTLGVALVLVAGAGPEQAQREGEESVEAREAALPGINVDTVKRVVDVEATVIRRESDWLELLACTPGTREHEAILTVTARPSHVHLALIMIGLEPGAPVRTTVVDEQLVTTPPHGPKVAVHIVLRVDGQEKEIPANEWICDRTSEKPLEGNEWLFTGSQIREHEGERIYMADINGTVLSLVNFGDDVLARQTDLTPQTDGENLIAHTQVIPEVGAKVLIRLRPAAQE